MRIHLRKRKGQLSSDKAVKGKKNMMSLYLAYHEAGKKVKYEWLKLYIYECPKTNLEKDHNKETLLLAENVRAKRLLDVQTRGAGFVSGVRSKISFLNYFKILTNKRREESDGNYGNWESTYMHLQKFCNSDDPTLEQIDDRFLEGFKDYLSKNVKRRGGGKLNANSAQSYFNKVKACLREAYNSKMIKENPCTRVKGVKGEETRRQFLTLEELQKLSQTGCNNALLKKAFLFAALTGLRWSDVKALTWDKIHSSEMDGYSIHFTQKKTKGIEVLPISKHAVDLLGETSQENEEIFKNLSYHTWMNDQLQDWVNRAGIKKKITFHCARHSFATLQLSMDTDIMTISKMLGHRHLKTTEIYAKVVDKSKIAAAQKMTKMFMLD